jgi:hypothetical protein
VEATQLVELMEAPAEVTVVVEVAAPAPLETPAPDEPFAAKAAEDAAAAAATAAPAGMGPGIGGAEVAETQVIELQETLVVEASAPAPGALVGISASLLLTATDTPVPDATPEPSLTPTLEATATAEPSPTEPPVPTATPAPTLAPQPTQIAAVEAQSETSLQAPAPESAQAARQPGQRWLVVVQLALGLAFVVLGTLTVILMARRLKQT